MHRQNTKHNHANTKHSADWNLCMFCQKASQKHRMRSVATMEKIISLSENDVIMSVSLATVTDRVASEGKYHLQ